MKKDILSLNLDELCSEIELLGEKKFRGKQVYEWLDSTENFRIPSDLVPKCPVCGKEMDLNLRKDN